MAGGKAKKGRGKKKFILRPKDKGIVHTIVMPACCAILEGQSSSATLSLQPPMKVEPVPLNMDDLQKSFPSNNYFGVLTEEDSPTAGEYDPVGVLVSRATGDVLVPTTRRGKRVYRHLFTIGSTI